MIHTLPKISQRHQTIPNLNADYILGNIDTILLDDILLYKEHKKQSDIIDYSNNLDRYGFKYIEELLSSDFYTYNKFKTNSSLASILFTICQQFSFLKDEKSIDEFIYKFRVQMAIDIVEKEYYKKLNLLHEKIKRKLLEDIFLRIPNNSKIEYDLDKIPEINMVLKYICLRFNIGLCILNSDKSFHIVKQFPNRYNIILLNNNNSYMPLCSKITDIYLYDNNFVENLLNSLKKNTISLNKTIKEYKVAELKDMSIKFGLNIVNKKKEELYNNLLEFLKYKE